MNFSLEPANNPAFRTSFSKMPLTEIKEQAYKNHSSNEFLDSLVPVSTSPIHLVTHLPSDLRGQGLIDLANTYQRGGSSCVSMNGSNKSQLNEMKSLSEATDISILREDPLTDEYQIWESRIYGAHSFVLMPKMLDQTELQFYIETGRETGMEAVVLCESQTCLEVALATDAKIIAISAGLQSKRELKKLTQHLIKHSGGRIAVYASEIYSRYDVENIAQKGYKACMINNAPAGGEDLEMAIRTLALKA